MKCWRIELELAIGDHVETTDVLVYTQTSPRACTWPQNNGGKSAALTALAVEVSPSFQSSSDMARNWHNSCL